MYTQSPPLFEAPLGHEVGIHTDYCNCRECRGNFAQAFAPGWAESEWEAGVGQNPRVNTPLPRSGPGFVSSKPTGNQFGLPETIRAMQSIAAAWQRTHPNGPVMNIRDISFQGGGPMPDHKSHRKGVDVDIRPMRNDGQQGGITFHCPTYSRALTQELVRFIRANGILRVQYIFFNDPAIQGVKHWPNHDNHLHVRFFPPGGTPTTPTPPSPSTRRPVLPRGSHGAAVRDQPPLPPSPSAVPALIKIEPPKGEPLKATLFVNIRLGSEGRARPMTGIFIPKNYHTQPSVDLILYLHGFKTPANRRTPDNPHPVQRPDPGWSINEYWRQRWYRLREGVNDSRKNVILVAPTLGQFSQPGALKRPGGFDRYIDQVMAAFTAYGPYIGQSPAVGNIILACHSGGGSLMRVLALLKHRYTPLIRECWGFDCMYNGGDGKAWGDWARNNPNAKLYNYYRNTRGRGTRVESEILQCYNLSNVTVVPLHPEKISDDQVLVSCPGMPLQPGRISHEQVPITYWRSRIQGAPFLLER